ncbi:MAG: AAA family ATPase, partial [Spirochaetales bacterium]|nr:AAA family ATPase [Spirochaetales bacterium]
MKHNEKNSYNKIAFNRYGLLNLEYEDAIYEVWYVEDIINEEKLLLSQFKKKIMSFREQDIIKFKSEMDILAQSDHPNILKIHSVGEYNHWLYTLGETTENLRLSEYLKTNKQPELISILDIIKGIAKALSFAHSHNIVHGSIEPNKIWIKCESGKITNSKLNGFGLFPFMDLTSYADSGAILKTISYLSPEAVGISNSPINKISDIYSLGVLFYQLCTGVLPFYDDTIEGLVHKHIADSFILPSDINELINPDIDTLISGLLQKDQDKRYQNIDIFLQDLENLLKQYKEKTKKSVQLNFKTSFIGRRTEINIIKKYIKEADEANGKLLLISGESGSGKTRLITECMEQIDKETVCTLLCKCFPGENKTPYHIISDAFEQFYGYYKELSENERSSEKERLGTSVDNFGRIIVQVNNNMQYILGETQSLIKLEAEIENTRFYEVCTQFLCSLGRTGKPVVLFIDDLQWIDEGSLNILNEVGARIYKYPLLIVGTYRSEDVGDDHILQKILNNDNNINVIKVESLHYTQLRLLLSEILTLKPGNMLDELTGYVMNQSKGNPFFSIQLVKYLYEVGVLSQKYGKWILNGKNIDVQKIPSNLIDFIVKRITLLSHDEKELLECGAIIGTTFSVGLLLKITHMSEEIIDKIIQKALQLQLIEKKKPGAGQYRFYHDKIHDAFYNNAGKRDKKKIHGRIASVYEKNKTLNESSIFLIAHHYIKSNNKKKALSYALKAGTVAKLKYANEEAIRYFNIAKRNIESSIRKGSINWLEVNAFLIDLYLLIGSSDKAIKIVNDVLPYIKSKFTKADYYCKLTTAFYRKGDYEKCEEYGKKGLALLGEYLPTSKNSVFLGLIKELFIHIIYNFFPFFYTMRKKVNAHKYKLICKFYVVLNWTYVVSDLTKFIRSMLRILHLSETKMGKSKELAFCYAGYAGLCMAVPLFKRALKYHNKALRMREEVRDEHGIAQSLLLLGFCYEFLGNYKKGIFYFMKAKNKFMGMGDIKEYGRSFVGLVENYYLLSDY